MVPKETRTWIAILHVVLFAAGAAFPVCAQTPSGDAAKGRVDAQRSCAGCHVITEGARRRPVAGVPTFPDIARRSTAAISLRAFSEPPHPPIPGVVLRRRQIDDLVSYILSLRQQMRPAADSCCKAQGR
jgi:mono/diheme cytochrome c family protein